MSLIRPEVAAGIARWREVILGAVLVAVALWLMRSGWIWRDFVRQGLGVLLMAFGLAVIGGGWWRGRFRRGGQGPGVVQVTERRVLFMGPEEGGGTDLDDLTRLELKTVPGLGRVWALHARAAPTLHVPVDAVGADALFDAFAALPGLTVARLVAAVERPGDDRVVLWRANAASGLDLPAASGHL